MTRLLRPLGILVAVLLVAGGVGLTLRSGEGTYQVTAFFEKAIGLFPNSDVNILGVPVGKVTSVEPVGPNVKVEMRISDRYKVPDDAFAQIVPISVIADRFVQLHPPYVSGPSLEDGDVLDMDRTQIPAELDDVFKQLKKLLEAIEPGEEGKPGALGSLIVELNEALADREEDLKGTIVDTAALTGALSDAQDNLSGVLINLDELFQKLASRAGNIGSLNRNFALVMAALAESRDDLQGTLANLADMTNEVGRVVQKHGDRLGNDLELAANVLSKIVENRSSVGESLSWLPVVGIGVANAYHGGEINATDVRDNAAQRLECAIFNELPDGPVKDALKERCREQTGEPPPDAPAGQPTEEQDVLSALDEEIDCRESIRKVKRQLRRLRDVELPNGIEDEIIKPLQRKLRRLARECEGAKRLLQDPGGLLDRINDRLGENPDLDVDTDIGDLTGAASGAGAAPTGGPGFFERARDWAAGFFSFLGWSW